MNFVINDLLISWKFFSSIASIYFMTIFQSIASLHLFLHHVIDIYMCRYLLVEDYFKPFIEIV